MAKWPYNTTTWKRLRAAKLRQDPLCEYCPTPGRRLATHVDHEKPIADGGEPFDLANLKSACAPCHNAKTAREDGGFGNRKGERVRRGCDANGRPLDHRHPWNQEKSLKAGG